MIIFYNIFIRLYTSLILTASLFNKKAALWIKGRRDWKKLYTNRIKPKRGKRYWFHCASLGEFEQAKPVMERIKEQDPGAEIMLTFFSPSGFEARKNEPLADFVGYLPSDTAGNAKVLIDILKPDIAFFVKYEFWYHYIVTLGKNNVPLYLLSGIFRPNQPFFKWYGFIHRKMLRSFKFFFLQDLSSLQLLKKLNITNAEVTGDTRFDRVIKIPDQNKAPEDLINFTSRHKTIVAGSCWEAEESVLQELFLDPMFATYKFILVPHDISRSKAIKNKFPKSSLYSEGIEESARVAIIDSIGLLGGIYQLGYICFVGGGFSGALHNILEAAVWGKPVCFGPHTRKFPEADALVQSNGGFYVNHASDLKEKLNQFEKDTELYIHSGKTAFQFIEKGTGASARVLNKIAFQEK